MIMVRSTSGRFRAATWPVLMSSAVVPPIRGWKTSLDSPNTPWQLAHLPSQMVWPLATEPEPLGSPWKSGRTSMFQALTSAGVASRPMPGNGSLPCACAPSAAAAMTAASSDSRNLDILHLAVFLHQPGLDAVVVIGRTRAAHGAQLRPGRLHVAGLVDRAALDDGGLAVPHPVEVEPRDALALLWGSAGGLCVCCGCCLRCRRR